MKTPTPKPTKYPLYPHRFPKTPKQDICECGKKKVSHYNVYDPVTKRFVKSCYRIENDTLGKTKLRVFTQFKPQSQRMGTKPSGRVNRVNVDDVESLAGTFKTYRTKSHQVDIAIF